MSTTLSAYAHFDLLGVARKRGYTYDSETEHECTRCNGRVYLHDASGEPVCTVCNKLYEEKHLEVRCEVEVRADGKIVYRFCEGGVFTEEELEASCITLRQIAAYHCGSYASTSYYATSQDYVCTWCGDRADVLMKLESRMVTHRICTCCNAMSGWSPVFIPCIPECEDDEGVMTYHLVDKDGHHDEREIAYYDEPPSLSRWTSKVMRHITDTEVHLYSA